MSKRAVIYARISVTKDESVSIQRQIEAAEQYAKAMGWEVVDTYTDDGVSASANRPEQRPGWRSLLADLDQLDVVVIWKVDRLARRIADFWNTYEQLKAHDVSIASVVDNLDMTSTVGQIVAGVLAGFAQMEAEAISARVAGARRHLIQTGRAVGGTIPFGYRNVPNPDGDGKVLAQDPDQIEHVRAMVRRAQRGDTMYSIAKWLDGEGVATPTGREGWSHRTVERILRHPILAGATTFNPGHTGTKTRGNRLLVGDDGLPVINPDLAVLPLGEWRALVASLDNRNSPQAKPRALKAKTSGLLSALIWCGDPRHDEPVRMWRGTVQGREGYSCPECHQTITNFEDELVAEFLRQKGDWMRWSVIETVTDYGHDDLPEIDHQLAEIADQMKTASKDERAKLRKQQDTLLDLRDDRLAAPRITVDVVNEEDDLFSELWARAEDVEDRRAVLEDALERVVVLRGRPGRRKPGAALERLRVDWKRPDELGPRQPAA